MGIKVTKFGGSSLANAEQFKKVIDILKADSQRRYAVPSAPGKRFSGTIKSRTFCINVMILRRQARA